MEQDYQAWYSGWVVTRKGGPGSGNWGHAGRRGMRGGSLPKASAMSLRTGYTAPERQQYAKTGKRTAALIRKEMLQAARVLEIEESHLKAANRAKLDEIDDHFHNVTGPLAQGKVDLVKQHGVAAKQMPEYQELDRLYQAAKSDRKALWDEQTKINEQLIEINEQKRQLGRQAITSDTPAEISLSFGKLRKKTRPPVSRGRQIFEDIVEDRSSIHGKTVDVKRPTVYGPNRAYYHRGAIHMPAKTSERTTVHELGHWLEEMDSGVHKRAIEFLNRRTAGQQPVKLKDYWNDVRPGYGDSYKDHEIGIKDAFMDIYMGKLYGGRASEIISMGLEYLAFEPLRFAKEDPEYFDFMVDIARGQ